MRVRKLLGLVLIVHGIEADWRRMCNLFDRLTNVTVHWHPFRIAPPPTRASPMRHPSQFATVLLLLLSSAAIGNDNLSTVAEPTDVSVDWNCCCPRWTVGVEALLMRRGPSASQPLTDLAPQWNVADMHFNYEAGVRANVIRHLDSQHSVEVSYFGIYDQGTTLSRAGGGVQVVGPGFQYLNFAAQPYRFAYESTLHSVEANVRRNWGDTTTILAGFRWVELSEDFDHVGNTTPVYSMDSLNHLYGFQLGAECRLVDCKGGRLRIEGIAKAGAYYNSADGRAASTGAFGTPTGTASANGDGIAFVGETGLVGVYRLRDGLDLRFGYQVLWLDGIATAPNQLPNFNTNTGVATLNRTYSAFYHGGFIGVVGTF